MFIVDNIKQLLNSTPYLLSVSDIVIGRNEVPLSDYHDDTEDTNTFIKGEVNTILENPFKIREHNDEKFSIMDLRSIRMRNDMWIKEFISRNFWINLDKRDGLIVFNRLYKESITLYEERYLRQVPKSLRELEFNSIKDIRNFLSTTWEWLLGIYKCDLAKVFFSYAKSQNSQRYKSIKHIHEAISSRVFRWLALDFDSPVNISWSEIMNSRFSWMFWEWERFVWFDRYKSISSIVWKEIANVRYNSLEDFRDLHWFTFRVQSKDGVLLFLNYLLKNNIIDNIDGIDVSFMFTKEDIWESHILSGESKRTILRFIDDIEPDDKRREKWTSKRYSACSVKWKMKFKNPNDERAVEEFTWVEFKIELDTNENEYGTSFHGILDIIKVFRELTRLSWVIRFKDVVNQVNHFFGTLKSKLKEKWKVLWEYLDELYNDLVEQNFQSQVTNWHELSPQRKIELLERSLLRYVIDDLVPVKLNKRKRNVYFVHRNYLKQSEAGIQDELYKVKNVDTTQ